MVVRVRFVSTIVLLSVIAAACSSSATDSSVSDPAADEAIEATTTPPTEPEATPSTTIADSDSDATYMATIARSEFGVAHIEANDFGSLAFGQAYAMSEDHLCSIADQIIKVRSERSLFFGAGDNDQHRQTDIANLALDLRGRASEDLDLLDQRSLDIVNGFVAGYNTYLDEVGADGVSGWCAGEPWVRPIDNVDYLSVLREALLLASGNNLTSLIATAIPPSAESLDSSDDAAEEVALPAQPELASNAWGIGSDRSTNGGGLLIGNPHFPWEGSLRLWESHLTIPGTLDVYGASLIGTPGVLIGFNQNVAWSHTVSAGYRMTGYVLTLEPGSPTTYLYDGEPREMTSRDLSIEVLGDDGTVTTETQTIWYSHYGPILNFPGLGWSEALTASYRDANIENRTFISQFLDMNLADGMDTFQQAHEDNLGIPWVNTVSVSADGRAWYIDSAATPNLSDEAIDAWEAKLGTDVITTAGFDSGFIVLDGSDSLNEWVDEPGARSPGLVPWSKLPQLERSDWVFNANDSYWLSNPDEPLTGFSPAHGSDTAAISPRSKRNITTLTEVGDEFPVGQDGTWELTEIQTAILTNRSFTAQQLVDDILTACPADGLLADACNVLDGWGRTLDLDDPGAVLWREFITRISFDDGLGNTDFYAVPFDPADPVATPRDLANTELALAELEAAAELLLRNGFALEATFGELQYSLKGGDRIPIHGGVAQEGVENAIGYGGNGSTLEVGPTPRGDRLDDSDLLTADGYPVTRGSSFIFAVEFGPNGPEAQTVLTYGQSGDPDSPHFYDQTELFSNKEWKAAALTSDGLETYEVRGG